MTELAALASALSVDTVAVDDLGPLVPLLDAKDPLLFVRRGEGIAGIGEALRLEFSGPNRLRDAAEAWRRIAASATIRDEVDRQGTGLVAFGSFAFSDHSTATSVLIVPSLLIGRRNGHSWVTRTNSAPQVPTGASSLVPDGTALGAECVVELRDGELSSADFLLAVDSALESVRSRTVSKVVLARDLVGALPPGADLRHVLTALVFGYPDCFTFAVDGLVGSSPETLIRVDHGAVSARVLAGSGARGADSDTDLEAAVHLATSAKDLDEHQFALSSVMASLTPHTNALASSELPFTLKLPNLWHLASDVEGSLSDGSSALDLVSALHPTAAVAGSPTAQALALIDALEPFDRRRYAGPVGWVAANGDGEWAIALRCAEVEASGRVTAFAGAGIVEGSNAARELAETKLKFRPIVDALS